MPKDNKKSLPSFTPGQYISVRVPVPELGGVLQPRQYSLSDSPGTGYYRISVKREVARSSSGNNSHSPAGLVSNLLHDKYQVGDVVEVTYPMGEFHLSSDVGVQPSSSSPSSLTTNNTSTSNKKPMVLISAGVGVTPMISILNTALSATATATASAAGKDGSSSTLGPISWIHGAHDVSARAFHEHVSEIVSAHSDVVEAHLFVTTETADGASSSSSSQPSNNNNIHTYTGRIDLSLLPQKSSSSSSSSPVKGGLYLDDAATEYLVCGPRPFMDSAREYLVVQNGVDEARVLREVFGTGN